MCSTWEGVLGDAVSLYPRVDRSYSLLLLKLVLRHHAVMNTKHSLALSQIITPSLAAFSIAQMSRGQLLDSGTPKFCGGSLHT